jgi:two-component system phosphate regulon sensor histidine kinase PhoR
MRIRPGIRGKLFLISLAIIVVMALISGVYLEGELRGWLQSRIETELIRQARLIADFIEASPQLQTMEDFDHLADKSGAVTSSRVTIIAEDGTVLGDSEIPLDEVPLMENHGFRPEIREALAAHDGVSRRYSSTLEMELLYVAVEYERDGERGVVRVSMPLKEIDIAVARLRTMILIAGVVGLIVAAIMTGLASHFMFSALRTVMQNARQIIEGTGGGRLPVYSQDEIGGIAGSINRITDELEKVLSELSTERNHLQAVLEGMNDGVVAVDRNQKITLVNSAAQQLLEMKQSPVGRGLIEFIRVPALDDLVRQKDGTPAIIEFDLPSEIPRRILAHITRQPSGEGKVIVLTDVTEMRKLERARRDFFANASHELRTPVGIIQANAETLIHNPVGDPEKKQEFLDAIHRSSQRLSRLINDLLEISRIEEGKYEIRLRPTSIKGPADRAADALKQLASEKNITIKLEVPEDLTAVADMKALEEVIYNLLDNAVKYTQEGGQVIVRAVEVGESGGASERGTAGGANNHVRIEVEDNGPGIAPRDRERVFERFYRVDTGRSREMGGTGLGLSIVKHLVMAMNGKVEIRTASPRGSIFQVSLSKD